MTRILGCVFFLYPRTAVFFKYLFKITDLNFCLMADFLVQAFSAGFMARPKALVLENLIVQSFWSGKTLLDEINSVVSFTAWIQYLTFVFQKWRSISTWFWRTWTPWVCKIFRIWIGIHYNLKIIFGFKLFHIFHLRKHEIIESLPLNVFTTEVWVAFKEFHYLIKLENLDLLLNFYWFS